MRYYSSGEKLNMRREIYREQHQSYIEKAREDEILKEQEEERALNIYSSRSKRLKEEAKMGEAKLATQSILLSECIDMVFENSFEVPPAEKVRKRFINKMIKEAGVENLLSTYKTKTLLLSEFTRLVDKYTGMIMESAEKDQDGEIILDIDNKVNQMLDEIDKDEISRCSEAIRERVSSAFADFVRDNSTDKAKIEAILSKAQENINTTTNESMIEEYNRQVKVSINNVKTRRPKSIFESMVAGINKAAIKDAVLNESFTSDKQKAMEIVVESAKSMYTFLEMVNTLKLQNVDKEYIENVLNQIEA